jgi:hypothetical protein
MRPCCRPNVPLSQTVVRTSKTTGGTVVQVPTFHFARAALTATVPGMADVRWEYIVSETLDKGELDKLGEDEWEAVGVGSDAGGAPFVLFKRSTRPRAGRFGSLLEAVAKS